MSRYLWQVSYTAEGARGLQKEGGTSRRATVDKLIQGMGGRLEAFYYAFGDNDAYVIAELPGPTDAAAVSLTIASTGAAHLKTVVLLTPEEIDQATKRSVPYRAPGA